MNIKIVQKYFLLSMIVASLFSCKEKEELLPAGTFSILFENTFNGNPLQLKTAGDKSFDLTDTNGQNFNLSEMGYYVSSVEIIGEDGSIFVNPMEANAGGAKGYYLVKETDASSKVINLTNVPAGSYDKIRFKIGIDESGVQAGAAGGVLDPAQGAWFWNWNAGYIGMRIEGNAENSGQPYVDLGNGKEKLEGTFAVHIGGWKEIAATEEGQEPVFVNNVKTIELDLGSPIMVSEGLNPQAHLSVDAMKILEGIDFANQFAIHRPDKGAPFANKLQAAFQVDHVHQ